MTYSTGCRTARIYEKKDSKICIACDVESIQSVEQGLFVDCHNTLRYVHWEFVHLLLANLDGRLISIVAGLSSIYTCWFFVTYVFTEISQAVSTAAVEDSDQAPSINCYGTIPAPNDHAAKVTKQQRASLKQDKNLRSTTAWQRAAPDPTQAASKKVYHFRIETKKMLLRRGFGVTSNRPHTALCHRFSCHGNDEHLWISMISSDRQWRSSRSRG